VQAAVFIVHHDNRQGAFRGSSAISETSPDKVFHNFRRPPKLGRKLTTSMRLVWRQRNFCQQPRARGLSKVQKFAKLILSGRPQYAHARTRQLVVTDRVREAAAPIGNKIELVAMAPP
jgi:hypothetical protein